MYKKRFDSDSTDLVIGN